MADSMVIPGMLVWGFDSGNARVENMSGNDRVVNLSGNDRVKISP